MLRLGVDESGSHLTTMSFLKYFIFGSTHTRVLSISVLGQAMQSFAPHLNSSTFVDSEIGFQINWSNESDTELSKKKKIKYSN